MEMLLLPDLSVDDKRVSPTLAASAGMAGEPATSGALEDDARVGRRGTQHHLHPRAGVHTHTGGPGDLCSVRCLSICS